MKYLEEQEASGDSYEDDGSTSTSTSSSISGSRRPYGREAGERTRSTYVAGPERRESKRGTYNHDYDHRRHRDQSVDSPPEVEAETAADRRRRHRQMIDDQIIREAQKKRMGKRDNDHYKYQPQR
jgi:hypothetical protein